MDSPNWRPRDDYELKSLIIDVLITLLTIFSLYIIIGGIWEGKTASFQNLNPVAIYGIMIIAISLIGGLEGLQISVSSLYRKDLDEVRTFYPRAFEVHRRFRMDEEQVQRFFAGRQLFIVGIVFISSRFTAFPGMSSFPLLNIPIPGILSPWFQIIFLDFGLLGALVVYWFGNLTAQLVATDHPVAFLNIPGMGKLFTACLFVDKIKLPRTSKNLASFAAPIIGPEQDDDYPDRIPLSAEQKYRREFKNDSGFGISKLAQAWTFTEDQLYIRYQAVYEIGRNGISTIKDNNFSIPRNVAPKNLKFQVDLNRNSDDEGSEMDVQADMSEQVVGGYKEFTLSATAPVGEFEIGDRITFNLDLPIEASPSAYTSDRLQVEHPAKNIELYAEFDEDIYTLDTPHLNITNPVHSQTEGSYPAESMVLKLENPPDENAFARYSEDYPQQGSVYELEWNVTPKTRSTQTHSEVDVDSREESP